jgi:hypothetical protein
MGKPHEQLEAWKFLMELARAVYQMPATFPAEERYGFSQKMRRAENRLIGLHKKLSTT